MAQVLTTIGLVLLLATGIAVFAATWELKGDRRLNIIQPALAVTAVCGIAVTIALAGASRLGEPPATNEPTPIPVSELPAPYGDGR